jgi:hypothetical protein
MHPIHNIKTPAAIAATTIHVFMKVSELGVVVLTMAVVSRMLGVVSLRLGMVSTLVSDTDQPSIALKYAEFCRFAGLAAATMVDIRFFGTLMTAVSTNNVVVSNLRRVVCSDSDLISTELSATPNATANALR